MPRNKKGHCWCGEKLITGIVCEDGTWFPFGFANCPTHSCWFEQGDEEKWNERQKRKEAQQME